jgi:hypothetical protein
MKINRAKKIVVIGHIDAKPTAISLPKSETAQKQIVALQNYTRVVTDDNQFIDHIAYLKQIRKIPEAENFSVWEMFLC